MQLYATGSSQCSAPPSAATLSIATLIDPSLVPFHLVAGPALEVYTGDDESQTWILERLLAGSASSVGQSSLGRTSHWQSDTGILLQVEGEAKNASSGPEVTELLLYAASTGLPGCVPAAPLTPPRSSSPETGHEHQKPASFPPNVKVLALPLSSYIYRQLNAQPEPPTPPPDAACPETEGRFLPLDLVGSDSRKRETLDALFDDATRQIKKAKRHGGQTVAKVMAGQSQGAPAGEPPTMRVRKQPKPLQRVAPLPRSKSISSLHDMVGGRPASRGDPVARTKRSALSRAVSTGDLRSPSVEGSAGVSVVEQANKRALSRIVMAGMRLYGLSQRKRADRSRTGSEALTPTVPNVPPLTPMEEEDEFKLVYHQTYKAAAFAVRRQIGSETLSQVLLRDLVDRLLAIFCSDPFGDAQQAEDLTDRGGDLGNSAFDPPSQEAVIMRHCTEMQQEPGGSE